MRNTRRHLDVLEDKFRRLKIVDPACGSGAFLLKAVDVLLEIHKKIRLLKETEGRYLTELRKRKRGTVPRYWALDKWNEEDEAREIIEKNIFGVDLNRESVEITRLSLFLKVATTNRKLFDLSKNIREGNSLVSDGSVAGSKAFDWPAQFPDILADRWVRCCSRQSPIRAGPAIGAQRSGLPPGKLCEVCLQEIRPVGTLLREGDAVG